jgi:hypothetical protein
LPTSWEVLPRYNKGHRDGRRAIATPAAFNAVPGAIGILTYCALALGTGPNTIGNIMSDSQQKIDWTAVRQTALDCLNATWTLICFAEWSQGDDYGAERAALHLTAIDRACDTLYRAISTFSPGVVVLPGDALFSSANFDAIVRASVGEGARPDFRFGGVCCATAHQSAYVLLRSALMQLENGLNDELNERGINDQYVASFDDLHQLSPEALQGTLSRLEERESLRSLLSGRQLHVVRAWIDREWAAISKDDVAILPQQPNVALTPEEKTILEKLAREHPMTVVQADLQVGALNTVRKYLKTLMAKGLVNQPNGTKKGYGITSKGLSLVNPKC